MDDTETFSFAFDERYAWMLRLWGVTPENSAVTLGDELSVKFGRWKLATPVGNIAGLEITEDYRWYKAIGIRGSLADHGITFGTNPDRGLCVKFVEPVDALVLRGMYRHPGMTLTVADVDGLAAALRDRGVPG